MPSDGIVVHPTESVTWDAVYTRAAHNFLSSGFTDNFYEGRPLLKLLRERGKTARGGQQLVERVSFGTVASTTASSRKGDRQTVEDFDPYTAARYDWAYYKWPVVIYLQDEHQATSADGRVRLVQDKIMEVGEAARDQISEHLCATAKNRATDVNTLIEAIPADPTTGTFGGLSGAAGSQPGWRNQYDTNGYDWSAAGLNALREMFLDCGHGGRYTPDAVLLDQTRYAETLEMGEDKLTFNQNASTKAGTKVADLGPTAAAFMQRPIFTDPDWDELQDGKALILNFDGIQLVEDPKYAWKMTPFQSALVDGIDARVAWLRWVGQLTVSNRRLQGIMTALT